MFTLYIQKCGFIEIFSVFKQALSYWIDPWAEGGHETTADRSAALAALSERAVPYLEEQLRWRPSPIMQRLHKRFPNLPLLTAYVQGKWDPRGHAARSLGEFGPLAVKAIPNLTAASTTSDLDSSWYQRLCARAALIKIKQESLAPYIEKLKDTSTGNASSIENWYRNALMIGEFGTNATNAIPNLISALGPTNHEVIQNHALIVLGEIHSRPEVSVPAIVPFLTSTGLALRQNAVIALTKFRDGAKPAWADLTLRLDDTDPWVRRSATNALKIIDPTRVVQASQK